MVDAADKGKYFRPCNQRSELHNFLPLRWDSHSANANPNPASAKPPKSSPDKPSELAPFPVLSGAEGVVDEVDPDPVACVLVLCAVAVV